MVEIRKVSRSTKGITVLSLFDGIACGLHVLKKLGIPVAKYYASEIDVKSIAVAMSNHPEIKQVGSVVDLKGEDFADVDIILAGSPCQGFSMAGKLLAFQDPRSKLFFEFTRLLKEINPKYFFLENNRMKKEFLDVIDEQVGVTSLKVNSALISHQNRERHYWTNLPDVVKPERDDTLHLSQIVGDYEGIWVYPRGYNKGGVKSYKGKCPCITTSSWEHNFFKVINGEKVKFTPEDVEQVQGLPIGYTSALSDSQRYKKVGNGWSIPTIEHFFKSLHEIS